MDLVPPKWRVEQDVPGFQRALPYLGRSHAGVGFKVGRFGIEEAVEIRRTGDGGAQPRIGLRLDEKPVFLPVDLGEEVVFPRAVE